jgi:hypothetical protein
VSREIVASRWSLRWIFLPLLFLSFAFGLTVCALRVGVSSTAGIERLAALLVSNASRKTLSQRRPDGSSECRAKGAC